MRLWRRAFAALKDQNSLWIASLGKRTAFRNPEIETAVIKATSHDEFSFDGKNVEIVYKWIRLSSGNIKPLLWAISVRMEKTRSWVVALKGLMLMHGIFACKIPAVKRIGRFPFDLSNFKDGHSQPGMTWGHNTFIRAYYTFLDQKSTLLYMNMYDRKSVHRDNQENYSLMQELVVLQKFQGLLDMLLQIRPLSDAAVVPLILEAMTCVVVEIFDAYSRICSGIAKVLLRIDSAGKVEAAMALRIVQKAAIQGEELSLFFDICRELRVMNASECPRVEKIPEEDIRELEHIINGVPDNSNDNEFVPKQQEAKAIVLRESQTVNEATIVVREPQFFNDAKAIVVRNPQDSRSELRTIITHDWETFDEDLKVITAETSSAAPGRVSSEGNSFGDSLTPSSVNVHGKKDDLPDLISFL